MPTPTSRASATGTTAAITTGSFTVPAGEMILVGMGQRATSAIAVPSISDSQGLTWTQIGSDGQGSGTSSRTTVWAAISNGNAMTVTCTPSGTVTHGRVSVSSVPNALMSFSNVITGINSSGDPSGTLPNAPGSSSMVIGWAQINGAASINPPTGFTELDEVGGGTHDFEVAYDDTSPAQSMSWSTSGFESSCVILELKSLISLSVANVAVGSPVAGPVSMTQVHQLSATSVTVASPVVGPVSISQKHQLTAPNVSVASPAIGTVAISQVHQLSVANVAVSSPVLGSPPLTVATPITISNVAVGSPDIGQGPELWPDGGFDSTDLSAWVIRAGDVLEVVNGQLRGDFNDDGSLPLATRREITGLTIGKRYWIKFQFVSKVGGGRLSVGDPSDTNRHGTLSSSSSINYAITAAHTTLRVSVYGITTDGTFQVYDNFSVKEVQAVLTQKHQISVGEAAVGSPVAGPVTLTQLHQLVAGNVVVQAPELGLGAEIFSDYDFTTGAFPPWVRNDTVTVTTGGGKAIFTNAPSARRIGQQPILPLGKRYRLTYKVDTIGPGAVTAGTSAGTGTQYTAPGVYSHDFVSSTDLAQHVYVRAVGTTTAVLDYISLREVVATLTQQHALVASPLTVGSPELGSPALAQLHALSPANVDVGSPVAGPVSLTQAHQLTASSLVTSSPVFGLATLTQKHQLVASNLIVSSPVFGLVSLSQKHVLVANDLVVGSPVFGQTYVYFIETPPERRAGPKGYSRRSAASGFSRRAGPTGYSRRA